MPKQLKQLFGPKKKEQGEGVDVPIKDSSSVVDDDEPLLDLSTQLHFLLENINVVEDTIINFLYVELSFFDIIDVLSSRLF